VSTQIPWPSSGPLPTGSRIFLEASAGTGKTYAIEGIVVELIAEVGLKIDTILVITFTNAATTELRDRIRQRLTKVLEVLKARDTLTLDGLARRLLDAADAEGVQRRLFQALADIDRAPISTIHSFCQRMLHELAFESGQESELEVLGEAAEVREQLVADAMANLFAKASEAELETIQENGGTPAGFRLVARAMTGATAPVLRPSPFVPLSVTGQVDRGWQEQPLVQFASSVRQDYEAEIDRRAQLTYDGMLSRLAERLHEQEQAGITLLADAIGSRYAAAIVDEFQDTDAAQWSVLDKVFGRNQTRLFVVGDPKQSIYRFRGADIDVYVAARSHAERYQLDTNYRSDKPLIDALNHLWHTAALPLSAAAAAEPVFYERVNSDKPLRIEGFPEIPGQPNRQRRPLELRLCTSQTDGHPFDKTPTKPDTMAVLAQACAAECLSLLESTAKIQTKDTQTVKSLAPGDLAVLVGSHKEAECVAKQLALVGIPAVAAGRGSVFNSEPLNWLLAWLEAVAHGASERPARLLAVSPLIGWTADQLTKAVAELESGATLDDDQRAWQSLRQHLAMLSKRFAAEGFARMLDTTLCKYDVTARLLGSFYGERSATDLRHLAELCQAEDRRTRSGPRGLAEWLRTRQSAADDKNDEQSPRLESDAAAVQLITVHSSKGLEYPVVLLPFAWAIKKTKSCGQPLLIREGGQAILDLSQKTSPDRDAAIAWSSEADRAESMRLLYVAMTRARHHLVAWINRNDVKAESALSRLVLAGVQPIKPTIADWSPRLSVALENLQQASGGTIGWSVEPALKPLARWQAPALRTAAGPAARPFDATLPLGLRWQVASFTSLSAGHGVDHDEPTKVLAGLATTESPHAAIPARPGADDADADADDTSNATSTGLTTATGDAASFDAVALADPSQQAWLLGKASGADLPGGTITGEWLHGVFEELDFSVETGSLGCGKDSRATKQLVNQLADRYGVPLAGAAGNPREKVLELLPLWLDTPLDSTPDMPLKLPAGFSLRRLTLAHRIDEMSFDMRLGAGSRFRNQRTTATGCVDLAVIRRALVIGAQTDGFGGAKWCQTKLESRTADNQFTNLIPEMAGFLTGFIDLIFRVGGTGAEARYYIADYKSNAVRGPQWLAATIAQAKLTGGIEPARLAHIHYTRPSLEWAMTESGYHLQALIYTVALHRLLKSRLGRAYDFNQHVGGHLYLFLKGMAGPATARFQGNCLGVWADRWPTEAVLTLDGGLLGLAAENP